MLQTWRIVPLKEDCACASLISTSRRVDSSIECCEAHPGNSAAIAHVVHIAQTLWLVERVGGGDTGDEPGPAAKRQILKPPLNKNQNAALKFHDVDQVDEQPG